MIFDLSMLHGNRREMTELFLQNQGYRCKSGGVIVEYSQWDKKVLKVKYEGKVIKIFGNQDVHFYRGLHIFLQEYKNRCNQPFEIKERCYFSETGLMLDCSRNGTISIDMLKEFIRLCAACGMNQLYLYMEDVYEIPEDPHFGAYRSRYSFEELRELDQYGNKIGVELIPAIQTLAHLHTYLRWPKTKYLQDTEDILLAESEDTEKFVRLMISHASRPFSTKKIHVGMDEADLLGLGKYLKIHGYKERYEIMTKHLDMVHKICKEKGLEVMMWSDMFFRLKSPTGDYYDLPEDTEFNLPQPIPKDLTLVYWDYYQHEKSVYDKNIRLHEKLTDNLRFAGGGWTWNGIAPNYRKACATLKEGLASCRSQGVDKAFCTFWFDNGTETPVRTAIYSAIYFAQLCYHEEVEKEVFDKWLIQMTGYEQKAYELLDAFDSPTGVLYENRNADNPSKYILYQDVLAGLFDGQIAKLNLDTYYETLYEQLKNLSKKGTSMDEVFLYYQVLAGVLSKKAMLGVNLRRAYQIEDKEKLLELKEQITTCASEIQKLKEERKKIWFTECRPFGFEVLDIRIGGIWIRLNSAVQRIESYLEGAVDKLEELEEPMILYDKDTADENHSLCMSNFWQNIVSAGNIAGI